MCFLCISPFNLRFFLPSGGAVILNTQVINLVFSEVNYIATSPTAAFEAELLFESSPSKI